MTMALGAARSETPRLRGYPFLGVAPQIRRDPLDFFVRTVRDCGNAADLNVAGKRMVLANDPAIIGQVLQRDADAFKKSKFYDPLKPIGAGMLISEGERWVTQRKAAAPAFKGSEMGKICAAMAEEVDTTLGGWEEVARNGGTLDTPREMMRLALRIAMRTLFGSRLTEETAQKVSDALAVALRHAERRIWSVVNVPLWVPTPANRAFACSIALLDEVFEDIVAERRRGTRQGDLLDLLIDAFGHDRPQLRDMAVSFLITGHETTAITLAWAFYLLSRHREWALAVRREAQEVLGDRVPDIKTVQKLPVARAVVEESMRLYPPVWTFSRDALYDQRIGNIELKTGDTVMICAYALHRSPRLWDEPEEFRPERFLGDAPRKRTDYAYLPFGGGPRSCLGSRFAMMEGVIALAKTLQRFELDPVEGHPVEPEPMITLRPRYGLPMYPRKIDHKDV